jgi:ribosomal protein S18 acetylase RimI-like enzyme
MSSDVTELREKILAYPKEKCLFYYRYILDYLGSREVRNYSHTSKIIRRCKDDDFERILELNYTCFGNKKDYQIKKYPKLFRNICYVCEANGRIVAFMGFYVHIKFVGLKRVHQATAYSLCVDPSMRGKGTVLTLINESLKELKNNNVRSVRGCIDVNNPQSLIVHQRFGFKIIERNNKLCGAETYKIELIF